MCLTRDKGSLRHATPMGSRHYEDHPAGRAVNEETGTVTYVQETETSTGCAVNKHETRKRHFRSRNENVDGMCSKQARDEEPSLMFMEREHGQDVQ